MNAVKNWLVSTLLLQFQSICFADLPIWTNNGQSPRRNLAMPLRSRQWQLQDIQNVLQRQNGMLALLLIFVCTQFFQKVIPVKHDLQICMQCQLAHSYHSCQLWNLLIFEQMTLLALSCSVLKFSGDTWLHFT